MSTTKFEHSSPWPAFTHTVKPDSVSKVGVVYITLFFPFHIFSSILVHLPSLLPHLSFRLLLLLPQREESPMALKVSCGKCGNGLGHEFLNDGPKAGQSRF